MATVILDGYNVIHAVPELKQYLDRSLEAARQALVNLCREYRAKRGDIKRLYVVFDGRDAYASGSQEQHHGNVRVLFTHRPEKADEKILELIEAERTGGRFVVVSNDNEVSNNARAFGARVISAKELYEKARPGSARRCEPAATSGKMSLSARDARQITEEYRKHLEERRSPPCKTDT